VSAGEEWRDIPGYPCHQASTHGRIRSKGRWVRRLAKSGARSDMWRPERVLKLQAWKPSGSDKTGALITRISQEGLGKYRTVFAHHLVLFAFVGPCPKGMIGCHSDGDPTNNFVGNLRWDTHKANAADARRHGTAYLPDVGCGEKCPSSKLTNQQICEIMCANLTERGSALRLASAFGVSKSAIYEARRRYRQRPDLLERIGGTKCRTIETI